ncbi:MAG: ankyrin repeat domain-containing protein [Blastocatellia bacterium]|nr:ankyrin repeat domain-containing protein [Blastocatellia bacterium]
MRAKLFPFIAVVWMLLAVVCLAAEPAELFDAVKRRDHKALRALIGARMDVNVAQPDGATPLAWAVYLDDREAAELLLAAGAKVNTADEYGETPLTLACGNGSTALIRRLVEAGADVKATRWDGSTALMLAANAGNVEATRLLLDRGAPIDAAESSKGQTALMWAASEGHPEIVRLLIERGANVKAVSKGGFAPLTFATVKGDARSIKHLLAAGADPNTKLPDGSSALMAAAAFRRGAAAIALIDGGADVKGSDRQGNTALHLAAQQGDLPLVKKLLAQGADANARNARSPSRGPQGGGFNRAPAGDVTAIHLAARANHLDVVKALLDAGADPKAKADDGTTLLMQAAGSANPEMVALVFPHDSDVKAVTTDKRTLMHAAITVFGPTVTQPDICKVIRFLADKGAPLDERDARGRTPIVIGEIFPYDIAVDLLTELILKSGAKPKTPSKR